MTPHLSATVLAIFLAAALLPAAGPAAAQTGWEFKVTPYGWMAGLDGDLGTVPGLPAQDVSLSFGDIFDDLDYGLFLFASARNGPWVVFLDSSSVQTTSSSSVNGPDVASVEVESRTTTLALAVGRTVSQTPVSLVDAYIGARAWWLDNDFTVRTQPSTGQGTLRKKTDADWIDPLIGISGQYQAAPSWTIFGNAEVGGFGLGADLEWSVMAGASYALNDWFGLTMAWRHLAVDYGEDGITYDVHQSGPLLGATFRF
ncbi:hypothetical protein [Poseidonocella sp. HB161398]|uniref:hypothetical protein n=1 Tax=Poseidonocella sp. HB161398 TaxID=2320855 RepID=UPI001109A8B7|nr:hypothetical protein [Poseidonocella sp. HB161398]